jgi:hypothetical protein
LNFGWRFEFARLLFDEGRLEAARRELRTVLAQEPTHQAATRLHEEIVRALVNQAVQK